MRLLFPSSPSQFEIGLGEYEKALAAINRAIQGLCLLAVGNLPSAERDLTAGIGLAENAAELDVFVRTELDPAEGSPALKASAEAKALFGKLRSLVARRKGLLRQLPTAEEELAEIAARCEREAAVGSWPWLGAGAGRARLLADQRRWEEARAVYERLAEVAEGIRRGDSLISTAPLLKSTRLAEVAEGIRRGDSLCRFPLAEARLALQRIEAKRRDPRATGSG